MCGENLNLIKFFFLVALLMRVLIQVIVSLMIFHKRMLRNQREKKMFRKEIGFEYKVT